MLPPSPVPRPRRSGWPRALGLGVYKLPWKAQIDRCFVFPDVYAFIRPDSRGREGAC